MTAVIATQAVPEIFGFTKDRVDLVKNQILKDATDDELKFFLYHCQRTGLDPIAKQIYCRRQWNKKAGRYDLIIITSIDGYRLIANRTGKYAGNDDAVFDNEDEPKKASVAVYKIVEGQKCTFTASARWSQYYPGEESGHMWRKMPHLMLGKCAEALALRKAFPAELSSIYTQEEMDQAQAEEAGIRPGALTLPPKKVDVIEAQVIGQDFVIKVGKKHLGKKASEVPEEDLKWFANFYSTKKNPTPDEAEFLRNAKAYLLKEVPVEPDAGATEDIPF